MAVYQPDDAGAVGDEVNPTELTVAGLQDWVTDCCVTERGAGDDF
jgi:hypothetical protein